MSLTEQILAQAKLLAGELDETQEALLEILAGAAAGGLTARLRKGITPEDCKADFIAAGSLLALAALNEATGTGDVQEFKAGDLTVKRGGRDAASRCLQKQAELIIGPYLQERFAFQGV